MTKCIELLESLKDRPLVMEIGELKTDTTLDGVGGTRSVQAMIMQQNSDVRR